MYILKCARARFFFFIHTSTKRKKKKKKKKKKTGNSYNLIANHFHVKTASKFKFIRKCKKRFFFFFFCCCFFFFFFFVVVFCLNKGLFDLPRSEKQNEELFIFEKGVFWSCPGRNSRVVKAENLGAFAGLIPVVLIWEYPSPRSRFPGP